MTDLEIIGISGHAGTGKDFIAQHYILPLGYYQVSLAWHFKIWLIGRGIITYEEAFSTKPEHVRKIMQLEGTEFGRNVFGENIWCKTAYAWMQLYRDVWNINKFCIADVRFKNEADFIQSKNGKVFRIVAPERRKQNKLTPDANSHVSEVDLDDYKNFNGYIYNDFYDTHSVKNQINELLNLTNLNYRHD